MSFLNYFRSNNKKSASVAKERLQIIVAHQRGQSEQPDFMMKLQQEVVQVIRKYVDIDDSMVNIDIDTADNCSVLELNVTLPEQAK